jgi:hypothetical protein
MQSLCSKLRLAGFDDSTALPAVKFNCTWVYDLGFRVLGFRIYRGCDCTPGPFQLGDTKDVVRYLSDPISSVNPLTMPQGHADTSNPAERSNFLRAFLGLPVRRL